MNLSHFKIACSVCEKKKLNDLEAWKLREIQTLIYKVNKSMGLVFLNV